MPPKRDSRSSSLKACSYYYNSMEPLCTSTPDPACSLYDSIWEHMGKSQSSAIKISSNENNV